MPNPLQAEGDAEGLVELGQERRGQLAYPAADALHGCLFVPISDEV